jgi:NDP-sugar pyrophosphorylase family protein
VDAQAVILAGGQGTRLRPLTNTRPKPIVPLLNRPFLDYQIALLKQHGLTDIILSCSYRVDDVRAAMGAGEAAGVRLRYVVEAEPLGTAGGVRNAADLARGRLVVLNGDVLTDTDLGAALRFHADRGARTTICLTAVDDPSRYGLVDIDGFGAIRRFVEKPTTAERPQGRPYLINAGIYVIEADLLSRIPADRPVSIEREFFPGLLADGIPSFGFPVGGYWRDIGSPASYRDAQLDLLQQRLVTTVTPPGTARDGCWIGAGAAIEAGVTVRGPAVIGAGVQARSSARIGPLAVIGDGTRIAAGAQIEDAILWERVEVGEQAVLRGCIVGADAVIGAHASAASGVVLESGAIVAERARLGS